MKNIRNDCLNDKDKRRLKRETIEKSINEVKSLRLEKINELKAENNFLKEKLRKYEVMDSIIKISPEHKKLSPTEKLILSSGTKQFLEDNLDTKEQKQEISNFNDLPKNTEITKLNFPIIENHKNILENRLIEIQSSDYYTSMSDLEVDKTEIVFLDKLISNKEIFIRLEYLANVKYINKIEFLKPEIKTINITSNLGIPSLPIGIPNIPKVPNLSLTMPNKGGIPSVPNIGLLLNQPKTIIELDNKLEDIEYIDITKDDISVGDDTLYLGKFLFAKLFQNYLLEAGIKQIPASIKTSLTLDSKPLLKLKESYFIDNTFLFENLDRYLLLGYNCKYFEGYLDFGQVKFPNFNETPYSFSTDNENNLKDYANFFSIKFDYQKYIGYAINQVITEIKKQLHQYHSLEELERRFNYKYNNAYDAQKDILLAQFFSLQQNINARISHNRIEKILKKTPKAIKDLTKTITEYKEPEIKKTESKKVEEQIKKKERIMLLQALGIDVKSKTSDSMFAMKYEMQVKKLLKAINPNEMVDYLIEMAKGGLKLKDEKQVNAKDQDIARILLDNLIKYSQTKQIIK